MIMTTFKNRLDKFWLDEEVLYDYKTDLHGIGEPQYSLVVIIPIDNVTY